jgi:diguanylate cyclase (GGDEF)-like protein
MTLRYRTMICLGGLRLAHPVRDDTERGAVSHRRHIDGTTSLVSVVAQLRHESAALEALFVRSPVATALLDVRGCFRQVNDALCSFLGREAHDLIGMPLYELVEGDVYGPVGPGAVSQLLRHGSGRVVHASVHAAELPEGGPGVLLVTFDDATRRHDTERLLRHAALHDSLTNLPNRRLLRDRLDTALSRADRSDKTVAVLFVDLDKFKRVNDELGHDAGDAVLVAVARNIISALRTCDTVARIGGEEFVVVCEDVDSEGDVSRLVDRLLEAIRRPVVVDGHTARLSASIGVALPSPRHETSEALVRMADVAMYQAKEQPGVDYVLAEPTAADGALDTPTTRPDPSGVLVSGLLTELETALETDSLVLHYQPVVTVNGLLVGLEALLRWPHPVRGMLVPSDFLPYAEGTELAEPLTEWVLHSAITEAASWSDPALRVSVNVWARQVGRPGFAERLGVLLDDTGLAPKRLSLELHETDLAMAGPTLAIELAALRALGVGLAIDDYGTGISSLSNLRQLPVDTLKLDRTFVAGLVDDATDAGIVEVVAKAAHVTGRGLAAAGVETLAQLHRLRDLGFEAVQGYLTGAPASLTDLTRTLRSQGIDLRPDTGDLAIDRGPP